MREKGVRVMRDGREIGERCVCFEGLWKPFQHLLYHSRPLPCVFLNSISSTISPLSSFIFIFFTVSLLFPHPPSLLQPLRTNLSHLPSLNLSAPIAHFLFHSTFPHPPFDSSTSSFTQLFYFSFIQLLHTLLHSTFHTLLHSTFHTLLHSTFHTLLHSTSPHPPPFNLPHPPPFNLPHLPPFNLPHPPPFNLPHPSPFNSSTPFFHLLPVFFRTKELEIYPVEGSKPPQGKGLNRRAQVTLERAFPSDKNTGKLITVGWDG